MKIKQFDVVELKNNNRATILAIKANKYLVEVVDNEGKTLATRNISLDDIKQVIYTKQDYNLLKC